MEQIIRLPAAEFPPTYADTCLGFLRSYWEERQSEIERHIGLRDLPILEDADLLSTPLADKLARIAQAATGEVDRADTDLVHDSLQAVLESLFVAPELAGYTIPADFWQTPAGQMIAQAMIWLEGDELITLTEAARLSGIKLATLVARADRGKLRSYPDPQAANLQRGGRLVRRSDVIPQQ